MNKSKKLLLFFIVIFQASCLLSYTTETYSVTGLPDGFRVFYFRGQQLLNDSGQIAGTFIPVPGHAKSPAYWDPQKGVVKLDLLEYGIAIASTINNAGLVGVACLPAYGSLTFKTVLWNTKTNAKWFGPEGFPANINNENIVAIWREEVNNGFLWDFPKNLLSIDIDGYSLSTQYQNINGTQIRPYENSLSLFYAWQDHLLVTSDGSACDGNVWLNNKDEVIGLSYNPDMTLTKWGKNGQIISVGTILPKSSALTFQEYKILGFNNVGQILVGEVEINKNGVLWAKPYLLTPKK